MFLTKMHIAGLCSSWTSTQERRRYWEQSSTSSSKNTIFHLVFCHCLSHCLYYKSDAFPLKLSSSLPLPLQCCYHCHLNFHCHSDHLTGWWQTQTAAGALFEACLWLLSLNQRCDVNPRSTSTSSRLVFSRKLRWVKIWLAAIFIMWLLISQL